MHKVKSELEDVQRKLAQVSNELTDAKYELTEAKYKLESSYEFQEALNEEKLKCEGMWQANIQELRDQLITCRKEN